MARSKSNSPIASSGFGIRQGLGPAKIEMIAVQDVGLDVRIVRSG
jgi:hypothetical protein